MALYRYDDLPTAIAKARARAVWRDAYTVSMLVIDGFIISTPVIWGDAEIEDKIREDIQGLGFLFDDNGELGV